MKRARIEVEGCDLRIGTIVQLNLYLKFTKCFTISSASWMRPSKTQRLRCTIVNVIFRPQWLIVASAWHYFRPRYFTVIFLLFWGVLCTNITHCYVTRRLLLVKFETYALSNRNSSTSWLLYRSVARRVTAVIWQLHRPGTCPVNGHHHYRVVVNSTHGHLDTFVELTHLQKSQLETSRLDTGVNSTHGQLDTHMS